jgi:hypothetical protein
MCEKTLQKRGQHVRRMLPADVRIPHLGVLDCSVHRFIDHVNVEQIARLCIGRALHGNVKLRVSSERRKTWKARVPVLARFGCRYRCIAAMRAC